MYNQHPTPTPLPPNPDADKFGTCGVKAGVKLQHTRRKSSSLPKTIAGSHPSVYEPETRPSRMPARRPVKRAMVDPVPRKAPLSRPPNPTTNPPIHSCTSLLVVTHYTLIYIHSICYLLSELRVRRWQTNLCADFAWELAPVARKVSSKTIGFYQVSTLFTTDMSRRRVIVFVSPSVFGPNLKKVWLKMFFCPTVKKKLLRPYITTVQERSSIAVSCTASKQSHGKL
jgi:hypothetical protein